METFDLEEVIKYVEDVRIENREIDKKYLNNNRNSNNNKIQDGFFMAECKICKFKFKLSCRYTGEFPLCNSHRDYNNRLKFKQNK